MLRRYRLGARLTQEELAELAGMSLRGLVALENGERSRPHRDTIRMLADALQLAGAERSCFEAAARGRDQEIAPEPSADAPPLLATTSFPLRRAADSSPAHSWLVPLVGRARELEILEWHLAGQGAPVLVLAGEPGIGKTRLLQQAADGAARQDASVLIGGCQRRSGQEPYAPFPRAILHYLRCMSPTGLRDVLQGCEWLSRMLPELAPFLTPSAGSDAPPVEQERRLVFGAVGRLLANLARHADVALLLDDLQWAPVDALDLLTALLHDPVTDGLRVICAYRSTEVRPQDPLAATLSDLAHAGLARQFTVEALSESEARQLLVSVLDEDQHTSTPAQLAVRRAGGVPFYLMSYAHELRLQRAESRISDDVPWDVAHSIRQRVAALPPPAQEIVRVGSVVGRTVAGSLLGALVSLPEAEVLAGLDAACNGRLLMERDEQTYQFVHDVIREVIETDLGAARRSVLHGAIAEALERSVGEAAVEELADHYARSNKPSRALPYLVEAAQRAHAASAHQEEASLLAQAIEMAQRSGEHDLLGELHARRGKALFAVTRWGEARTEMEAALEGLPPDRDEQRAEILANLALTSHWVSDAASTRRYASEALSLAEELGREDLAVGAMSALVLADSSDGHLRAGLDRYRQEAARAGDRHPAPLAPGIEMASLILYWLADFDDAVMRAREAADIGRAVHDTSTLDRSLGNLGCALMGSGRYDEALQVFTEAQQLSHDQGAVNWLARSTAMRGGLHLEVFDFAGAEALAEEARELSRSASWLHADVSGGIDLLLNFARNGEIGRAQQLVDEVAEGVAKGQGAHGWLWLLRFAQAQAELALGQGRYREALQHAEDAMARARTLGRVKYEVAGLQARAQALVGLGRTHEAVADLQTAVDRARRTGDPAMFLRPASTLLAIDGSDSLLSEARDAVNRIVEALPDRTMIDRFEQAEPVRTIARLASGQP